jgi:hypothetical protein
MEGRNTLWKNKGLKENTSVKRWGVLEAQYAFHGIEVPSSMKQALMIEE